MHADEMRVWSCFICVNLIYICGGISPMNHELAIIGAGVMAEAIVRGIISAKTIAPEKMTAADVSPQRREFFETQLQIRAVENAADAVAGAKMVLLSVKPYQMEEVLQTIAPKLSVSALLISIAAGTGSAFIERTLGAGKRCRVIRAMPNTPMLIGAGMVAIAAGSGATKEDLATTRKLFNSAAKVIEVTEDKMDAVTAVSGSGPAYFFFLVEQMIAAGVELGLTEDESRTLAVQTAVGAGKMMSESLDSAGELRRKVTTPNGTTHAAISHMEKNLWPEATREALKKAAARSKELGK
jgi:pyrroline-5-carboxylate reductase